IAAAGARRAPTVGAAVTGGRGARTATGARPRRRLLPGSDGLPVRVAAEALEEHGARGRHLGELTGLVGLRDAHDGVDVGVGAVVPAHGRSQIGLLREVAGPGAQVDA